MTAVVDSVGRVVIPEPLRDALGLVPGSTVDTSVAVALLVATHRHHGAVVAWVAGRDLALSGHAAAQTSSVMTPLPGDLRAAPCDVADLVGARFRPTLTLRRRTTVALPRLLAALGAAGAAVHDAMVALAAKEHGAVIATRDARATSPYRSVGVGVVTAGRAPHGPGLRLGAPAATVT